MTVDLQMMLDLRDLQVAMDVAKRAELGWFDVEFTMYGCSYLHAGKRYYRISAAPEQIFDFIEVSAQSNIFSTNVMTLTKKCPVPVGMRDYIARDVKKSLAIQMKEQFSREFFCYLEETAFMATEASAMPLLLTEQDKVAGCFDAQKLKLFQELTDYTYRCRKITMVQYQQLLNWIKEERRNMEENFIIKDIFEKTFYGIAYEAPSGIEYMANAQKSSIHNQKCEMERRGIFVTPIFSKTYWYNYKLRLPEVHNAFIKTMRQIIDTEYIALIRKISAHNTMISKETFLKRMAYVSEQFGEIAAETFLQYGYRWGIMH